MSDDIDSVPDIPHTLKDAVTFSEKLTREIKERARPSYIDVYLAGPKVWEIAWDMKPSNELAKPGDKRK